ncbi:MAG: hypothetical protein ACP5Q4_09245, partial [Candidatus Caldatribacteriaceae bacterium]
MRKFMLKIFAATKPEERPHRVASMVRVLHRPIRQVDVGDWKRAMEAYRPPIRKPYDLQTLYENQMLI